MNTTNATDNTATESGHYDRSTTPSVSLTQDGDEGALLSVMTNLTLDVFGFVTLSGSFAFKKANGNFVLTDGHSSTVRNGVNYLEVGGHVDSAFAGVGSIGFKLSDVNFGAVLVSDNKNTPLDTSDDVLPGVESKRGHATLSGIDGLTATVTTLSIVVNKTSSTTSPNKVLDFVDTVNTTNATDNTATSRDITTVPPRRA